MTITGIHHVQLAMPPGGEAKAVGFYEGVPGIPFDHIYVDDPFGNRIELIAQREDR